MKKSSVGVIDYGLGNLGSVMNMFRRIDVHAILVSRPEEVMDAERLLLPGVGSFDAGAKGLASDGLGDAVVAAASSGTPILGICLGMQLLTQGSDEGVLPGLGLVEARCQRLRPENPTLRVPHMGWNWIKPTRKHILVDTLPSPSKFYFAHSFFVRPEASDISLAETDFGGTFTSIFAASNVCGAQFHPEKSHIFGMSLLNSFAQWTP